MPNYPYPKKIAIFCFLVFLCQVGSNLQHTKNGTKLEYRNIDFLTKIQDGRQKKSKFLYSNTNGSHLVLKWTVGWDKLRKVRFFKIGPVVHFLLTFEKNPRWPPLSSFFFNITIFFWHKYISVTHVKASFSEENHILPLKWDFETIWI